MSKKSKFLLSAIILLVATSFFIIMNPITNAQETNSTDPNSQNIQQQDIFKQEEGSTQEINIEEVNVIQELNVEDDDELEEVDMETLTQEGKIDLSPEEVKKEPEFADVELLRLDDKLLETKLIHYTNSLVDVVQYKIEKNKKNLEIAHEEIISNMEEITNQHAIIDKQIEQQNNFQDSYEKSLETMNKIILFLSVIGLIIAFLIYYIWRSFVNVNKNESTVISVAENMNHQITELKNEIEMLKKKME
jgi:zona occludens toxin (predicted ATPase)